MGDQKTCQTPFHKLHHWSFMEEVFRTLPVGKSKLSHFIGQFSYDIILSVTVSRTHAKLHGQCLQPGVFVWNKAVIESAISKPPVKHIYGLHWHYQLAVSHEPRLIKASIIRKLAFSEICHKWSSVPTLPHIFNLL